MGISEQVQKDMVDAMRSRDELRLSTLRMVKAALKNKEIDKRAPLDDKEAHQVLATLIKQRTPGTSRQRSRRDQADRNLPAQSHWRRRNHGRGQIRDRRNGIANHERHGCSDEEHYGQAPIQRRSR
jgi:hypothetical protein